MKVRLKKLLVSVHKGIEEVIFEDLTYFWGRMGAGKSSIPRLIDYCLGGDIDWTPAMQSEFVSATLILEVNSHPLEIERQRDSNQVRVAFDKNEVFDSVIPLKSGNGEAIPGTGVETLSDLMFFLSDQVPPRVRKSRLNEDSEIERLSLRELLWYCYLVQEDLDSNFFHLDKDAHPFKRYQSKNVLRYIIGFHQDRVTELEIELFEVRSEREALVAGISALEEALESTGLNDEEKIHARINEIAAELKIIDERIFEIRQNGEKEKTHAVETLRGRARQAAIELTVIDNGVRDIESSYASNERHLNELIGLKFKFRRVASARAVLEGVAFEFCPRCTQNLVPKEPDMCAVCGQPETAAIEDEDEIKLIEKDADARVKELKEILSQQKSRVRELENRKTELAIQKSAIDSEYSESLTQYDSRYLSQALSFERQKAKLENARQELEKWKIIPETIASNKKKAQVLLVREVGIRSELKAARSGAEQDLGNLRRLATLFLDCLVKTRLPAFSPLDYVEVPPRTFLPQVTSPESDGLLVASYANLGSGGIKTLFKCCFAVAVHRLATEISAPLPSLLIIDSPMKNISVRENPEQFAGFYDMLYDLASTELLQTQIIVVDNDFYAPSSDSDLNLLSRHMVPYEEGRTPGPDELPLISYYEGH